MHNIYQIPSSINKSTHRHSVVKLKCRKYQDISKAIREKITYKETKIITLIFRTKKKNPQSNLIIYHFLFQKAFSAA